MAKVMQYEFHQWTQLPAEQQLTVETSQHQWVVLIDVGRLKASIDKFKFPTF